MLKEIKLKNFKLHKDTELKFGKITLFIGPNNSGKSSAIHAMQLLKREMVRQEKTGEIAKDMFIDIGDGSHADNFAHRGEKSFEIEISGTVPLENFPYHSDIEAAKSFIAGDEIKVFSTFTIEHSRVSPKHRIEFLTYDSEVLKDKKIRIYTKGVSTKHSIDLTNRGLRQINKKIEKKKVTIEKSCNIEIFKNKNDKLMGLRSLDNRFSGMYSHSRDENSVLSEVVENILLFPGKLIESFHFVYPIRGFEYQSYPEFEKAGELNLDLLSLDKRAESIPNAFHFNTSLGDEVYEKMKEVIPDVKFVVEGAGGHRLKLLLKDKKVPFLFEGLGSHQMLFMLLPIALAKSNETIFIEEPETHLHPKAQYELSKLFTEIAEKQEKQLVMTTHSEHIVFGFLNRVAKKQLKKKDLKIYFFENKDGEAKVKELKVNEIGQVDDGLPGFFEAEVESLLEFLSGPEEEEK